MDDVMAVIRFLLERLVQKDQQIFALSQRITQLEPEKMPKQEQESAHPTVPG